MTIATPALVEAALLNENVQINLVSDVMGLALHTDPNLVNPWGIAYAPTGPFWIADNGAGVSTLYNGSGTALSLVVTVPPAGSGSPTGIVFNGTAGFAGSHFIFAAEDGSISAWTSGTSAVQKLTTAGAVYKGLATGNNGVGDFLYAANFATGKIDVFDSSFAPALLAGAFTDPGLPSGFAPFNVENIGGKIYVTYAKQDGAKHDDVPGMGNGFVDVFDTNGNFLNRLVSQGALNSPWGMALAPGTFGPFGGDLLVGNFGDGTINAFDPMTGAFLGTLDDVMGNPLVNQGLWALIFGNGAQGGDPNTLYFTAGIPAGGMVEDHGLFGQINAVPEPSTVLGVAIGLALLAIRVRRAGALGR